MDRNSSTVQRDIAFEIPMIASTKSMHNSATTASCPPFESCEMLALLALLLLLSCSVSLARPDKVSAVNPPRRFTIDNDQFYKDDTPFRILGGSLHYFRVHPEYWEDRLLRAKALGLNVIQTYVPWNLHQPQPDRLNFEEKTTADIAGFLTLAQTLDLLVMLRPGPYICGDKLSETLAGLSQNGKDRKLFNAAEWDFGGFPAWLLAVEPKLSLRTSDANYLRLVDSWWSILLPKIVPFLYSEGGPVIMVQIENEYGSFGADKVYMRHLVATARAQLGEDVILYTTDGAELENLQHGSLSGDEIYTSVDFPVDWDAAAAFKLQKSFNAPRKSPSLSSEFYTGWLTHWSEPLAHTDALNTAAALDKLLSLNASVVLYMVHGGTNFGFNSGSNTDGTAYEYLPDITSYDYDAPIGESGNCDSAKFKALRAVLSKYSSSLVPDPPPLPAARSYGIVKVQRLSYLFDILDSVGMPPNGLQMDQPLTMEMLDQVSGFILYRSTLPTHTRPGSELLILEVHDRAQVFVIARGNAGVGEIAAMKRMHVGTLERWFTRSLLLPATAAVPGLQLDILVENMGRVNYGSFLYDAKGITTGVFLDGIPIVGWRAYSISLESVSDLTPGSVDQQVQGERDSKLVEPGTWTGGPSFHQGWLYVDEPADTFVSLRGWSKGVLFINNFNLGRFWPVMGPQCSLYVPAPLLHTGANELILLELENPRNDSSVFFSKDPDFSCKSDTSCGGHDVLVRGEDQRKIQTSAI